MTMAVRAWTQARSLLRLIKKVHIYAGLLSFTAFILYSVADLRAAWTPPPWEPAAGSPGID